MDLAYLIQKQMNLNSNIVPLGLEFSFIEVTTTLGIQLFWFKLKFGPSLSKNLTNFSTKLVPVVLDYLVTEDAAMGTIYLFKISSKKTYSKNYSCWILARIVTTFVSSCPWDDLGSFCVINKQVTKFECKF